METTETSTDRWTDREDKVHTDNGLLTPVTDRKMDREDKVHTYNGLLPQNEMSFTAACMDLEMIPSQKNNSITYMWNLE